MSYVVGIDLGTTSTVAAKGTTTSFRSDAYDQQVTAGSATYVYDALGRRTAARNARREAERLAVVLGHGASIDRQVDAHDPLEADAAHAPGGTSPA